MALSIITKGAVPTTVLFALLTLSSTTSAGIFDRIKEALQSTEGSSQLLPEEEIAAGLKEALRVGTENVVGQLGQPGGFNLDPQVHIPLPKELDQVRSVLEKIGMDDSLTDLEQRLNSAAEIATPKAKTLFVEAIGDMTLDDVMAIYNGPNDSATQYFEKKMSAALALEMKPVVNASLSDAGAVKSYEAVVQQYNSVPFVPEVNANLDDYVVQKGLDGIFKYLAREEAAIRENPAKRTTDLLKRVFASASD